MGLSNLGAVLAIVLCLVALVIAIGVFILLAKLGIIAFYWQRPEPRDTSRGHTLAQSRSVDVPNRPTASPEEDRESS